MLVHLSHVCHSLYQLTSPNTKFQWLEIHDKAFLAAKDMISKNILNTRFDPSKRSKVYFDASLFAVCGILTQDRAVVSCASKTLNKAQKKLPTIERELFAFAFSCKKFRIQLHGNHFDAVTDHKPLVGLTKKLDDIDNQRITAMLISTSEYSYSMSYLPGKKNILADYGTRQIPQTDWEPPLDDPLELNPFLDCSIISAALQFPVIAKHCFTSTDFEEINKFKLNSKETPSGFLVKVNEEEKILVPTELRSAWQLISHFITVTPTQLKFFVKKICIGLFLTYL